MPIYEYECLTCGTTFEKRQSFSEEPKADCPNGHPETRRLLSAPAIVFKGSGFYINDSKNGTNGSGKSKKVESETGSESKPESKSESKSEAKSESKSETKAEAKTEAKAEAK
jgi:putative FmdB family regulatory protein